jgi:hypothetical protein
MPFYLYMDNHNNTFRIVPSNNATFSTPAEGMVIFQGNLYGNMNNSSHVNYAVDFAQKNDCIDGIFNEVFSVQQNALISLQMLQSNGFLNAQSSGSVFVCCECKNDSDFPNDFADKLEKLDDRLQSTAHPPKSATRILSNTLWVTFDFNDLAQVTIVRQFIEESGLSEDDEIIYRETLLINANTQLIGKIKDEQENLAALLKASDLNQWHTLLENGVGASKKTHLRSILSSADFSWVTTTEHTIYARAMASIIEAYNTKKGGFRAICPEWLGVYNFGSYSAIIRDLKKSADKTPNERKALIAEFLANVIFDTTHDKEISAGPQAILTYKNSI